MSKMTKGDWEACKFFKETENWGDPFLIERDLIDELEEFRYTIGTPIFISCGTQGKHEPNSFHYKGMAVDIMFPELERAKLPDIYLTAHRFGFQGLGIYPHWSIGESVVGKMQRKVLGGLHLDIRPTTTKHTWIGLPSGEYVALSFYTMYQLFHGNQLS